MTTERAEATRSEERAQASGGGQLWAGRFDGGPAEALQRLNDSFGFDRRMFAQDIEGSRAHVTMLNEVGILTDAERSDIVEALAQVEEEMASGRFEAAPGDEDIHTAVERRVTEIAPEAGGKIHTGRSRNDQVATDLRLWTRRELHDLASLVISFQETLLRRAEEVGDAYLPAYTHLQQAQPVTLAHHLLAHCWALARDVERLLQTLDRVDVSPLGAGALAGSSLPLDPVRTAELLDFSAVFDNSLDAVSDRDFVAEALFDLSLLGVHLSRIGEELILWSTTEFGFVSLDDAFSTGSSMMPQKKNPDIAELARGKAGRLIGHLTGFLTTLKGLPLTYNKDLQEDKEPLFDACDTVRLTLLALDGMVSTLTFDLDRMAAQADNPYAAATDLAEFLVNHGMPFRAAHHVVGSLVRAALAGEASLAELVSANPDLGVEAARLLEPGASMANRTTRGGGGPGATADELERFRAELASASQSLG
ncbi:MAG: argininosuccinate lyase [Acidimicrobiales bacterium]